MDSKELQSRRQFFKDAAKRVLPVVGAIALSQVPFVSHAHESQDIMDCSSGCAGNCYGSCGGNCQASCTHSCDGDCYGGCRSTCSGSCEGYCAGSCSDTCAYSSS